MRKRQLTMAALVVNSSLGFALGTVVALLVYQIGLVAVGVWLDRGPVWYPDRVEFTVSGPGETWFGGIVLVLLLGWALASIYRGGTRFDGTRLAVLWVMLHCFRQGLLPLVSVPFNGETETARAWVGLGAPEALTWLMGVLGVAGLMAIGLLAAPALLRFARHRRYLAGKRGRMSFVAWIGLVPWLIGALLALPMFLPQVGADGWKMLLTSGVFLIFTLVASPETREIEPVGEPVRLAWGTLVSLALLVAAARVFLTDGLLISL